MQKETPASNPSFSKDAKETHWKYVRTSRFELCSRHAQIMLTVTYFKWNQLPLVNNFRQHKPGKGWFEVILQRHSTQIPMTVRKKLSLVGYGVIPHIVTRAEQLNHILMAGLCNDICIPAQQLHHPNNSNGIRAAGQWGNGSFWSS